MRDRGREERQSGLRERLRRIDGQPWPAYRRLVGEHEFGEFRVSIDHVPPDPFAGPARLRLIADHRTSGLPEDLVGERVRRIATEDFILRESARFLEEVAGEARGRRGPAVSFAPFGAAVLERSHCHIGAERAELRLLVELPAAGRRIHARRAEALFGDVLLPLAGRGLLFGTRRVALAREAAALLEDHQALQRELRARGLVAFVGDGARLARAGGNDETPRADGLEIAFSSPESLRVTVDLPHAGETPGMGIPGGVTVIVGGAFHGKSTLLEALASGVYPHRAGDGRERVAALPEAVSVRAEPGRPLRRVDVSPFFSELPSGASATGLVTDNASGSTSQAASIVEALEVGARVLLLDEDRSATNLLVRDGRMQRLVPRPEEPIVPFLDRVRELYERQGVSTILVTGGTGDYLEAADLVVRMDEYRACDVTARAKEIAHETRSLRLAEPCPPWGAAAPRRPTPLADDERRLRVVARGMRAVLLGEDEIDLSSLEQLVEPGQLRAIGWLVRRVADRFDGRRDLPELVTEVLAQVEREGLDSVLPPVAYDLALPRRFELAAALNRWPRLQVPRA